MAKQTYRQLLLFKTRGPNIKRAHCMFYWYMRGTTLVVSICKRCAWISPVHRVMNQAEIRRGIPCPVCNSPDRGKRRFKALMRSISEMRVY